MPNTSDTIPRGLGTGMSSLPVMDCLRLPRVGTPSILRGVGPLGYVIDEALCAVVAGTEQIAAEVLQTSHTGEA